MPQLDKTTVITNIIPIIFLVIMFYMVTIRFLFPRVFLKLFLQKKYINFLKSLKKDLNIYMNFRRKQFEKLYIHHLNLYIKAIRKEKKLRNKLNKAMFEFLIKKYKVDYIFTKIELHIFAYFKTMLYYIKEFNESDLIKKGILARKIMDLYGLKIKEKKKKLLDKDGKLKVKLRKDILEKFKIPKKPGNAKDRI